MIKNLTILFTLLSVLPTGKTSDNFTNYKILSKYEKHSLSIKINDSIKKEFKEEFYISSAISIKTNNDEKIIASLNFKSKNSYSCGIISYKNENVKTIYSEPYCKWTQPLKITNKEDSLLINFPMRIKAYSDAKNGDSSVEITINTNTFKISF